MSRGAGRGNVIIDSMPEITVTVPPITVDSVTVSNPVLTTIVQSGTVTAAIIGTPTITGSVMIVDSTGRELDFRQEAENANSADHGILIFARDYESNPQKYRQIRCDNDGYLEVRIEGEANSEYIEPFTTDYATGALNRPVTAFGIALPADSGPVIGGTTTNPVVVQNARPSTSTVTQKASSASNSTLCAANTSRRGLMIMNDSTQTLYIKYGATASTGDYSIKMLAGAYFEAPHPCYTGKIDGVWASANGYAYVTEVT